MSDTVVNPFDDAYCAPNGIGQFAIGISPIGTRPPLNVWLTVMSQFANSPTFDQLIANMEGYIDQTENFDLFFDNIWNVLTAQGYGLDVWGRIVGVNRVLQVSGSNYFGFAQALPTSYGWGQAPWYSGETLTGNYPLSDAAFRTLILAKALANICNGSIPAINQILLNLFPNRGNCYVTSGGDMTMQYVFKFALSPVELAIVTNSGVLPTPAGVASSIVVDLT
jgi:hypothetical protein